VRRVALCGAPHVTYYFESARLSMNRSLARRTSLLLSAVSIAVLAACGAPRGATPMPEPPALDPSHLDSVSPLVNPESTVTIAGEAQAATPHATVRVTDLDRQDAPVATTAADNGSFTLVIPAAQTDELRLELLLQTQRSVPYDFIASAVRTPSARHACVELSPGLSVDVSANQSLVITNHCASSLEVANPRLRLGLPQFALPSNLPVTLSTEQSTTIALGYTPVGDAAEDILFLDLTLSGQTFRYPIGLFPTP
jgi:hypothetical protein